MSVITGDRRFSSEENKERQGICGLPNGDDPISSELLQGQNRIKRILIWYLLKKLEQNLPYKISVELFARLGKCV